MNISNTSVSIADIISPLDSYGLVRSMYIINFRL